MSPLRFCAHVYILSKLSILESLHNHHYVHLDIKPENFMLGTGKMSNQVYLFNFGLTELFCNLVTCTHTTLVKGVGPMGTVCYSSINSHLGLMLSCCDDLESLFYTIVYLAKGGLPWQGIAIQPDQVHHNKILRIKQVTMAEALCKGLPWPFIKFIWHVQSLCFEDKPDHQCLHDVLIQCVHTLSHSQMEESSFVVPSRVAICI